MDCGQFCHSGTIPATRVVAYVVHQAGEGTCLPRHLTCPTPVLLPSTSLQERLEALAREHHTGKFPVHRHNVCNTGDEEEPDPHG